MESKRNGIIDVIKFILSIWVLTAHYCYIIGEEFSSVNITLPIVNFAKQNVGIAVAMFFVLSGYFAGKLYKKTTTVQYMKKKIRRIYPVLIISIVIFIVLSVLYLNINGHFWAGRTVTLKNSILSLTGISMWIDNDRNINGAMWFISVLMFCYFLFVVIKNSKLNDKIMFPLIAILGMGIYLWRGGAFIFQTDMGRGVFSFFIGVNLPYLSKVLSQKTKLILAAAALGIFILALAESYVWNVDFIGESRIVGAVIVAPAVIAICEFYHKAGGGTALQGFQLI